MGLYNELKHLLPWNAYAEQKQAQELAKLAIEMGIYKDTTNERPDQLDYNPSDFDLEVYDKMMTDGQVKAAIDMIKLSSTARGFTVTGNSEESRKYAEFILENFESIRGNMEDVIAEMLSALEYGYSVTEKVFEYNPKGQIILKKLKVLDPHKLKLKIDKFGDLEYVQQNIGSQEIRLQANKVILYTYDKRFGNLYGNSALRTTYKHWLIKDKLYRFANIAYERYGTPLLVGTTTDANDVGKMKRLLSKINGMTGLAISGGDKVEAVQMQPVDFIGYIEHHDRKIMESMLVPPMLLGLSRGQSGSYALSGNQFDIFMIRLEALQRDLKALLEEEIVRPLIDYNFPNAKEYPSIQFKPLANEDITKLATVFTQMITAGVISPTEDWLREELGFPAMSEETKREIEAAKQEAQKASGKEGSNGGNTGNSGGSDGASQGK